jgi:predicted DNA-binding transcriptional regulator YafY
MVMPRSRPKSTLTPTRLARLYRLLTLIGDKSVTRATLVKKLKLDVRGFYRDLEKLRELKITLLLEDGQYRLKESLDAASTKLPFPDPKLSLREAMLLSEGDTVAHERLRRLIEKTIPKDLRT